MWSSLLVLQRSKKHMYMVRHHDKGMHVNLAAILEQTVLENYCSCLLRKKKSLARASLRNTKHRPFRYAAGFVDRRSSGAFIRHELLFNVLSTEFLQGWLCTQREILFLEGEVWSAAAPGCAEIYLRRRGRLRSTIHQRLLSFTNATLFIRFPTFTVCSMGTAVIATTLVIS